MDKEAKKQELRKRLIHDWEIGFWFVSKLVTPRIFEVDEGTKWLFWRDHFRIVYIGVAAFILLPSLLEIPTISVGLVVAFAYGWFITRWRRYLLSAANE